MIKDKYLRKRGGTAKVVNVSCSNCGKIIFIYQKDGPGWLKRCYLNRILGPEEYSGMHKNPSIKEPKDMKNLICPECGTFIASPMKHKDGRLAYHLIRKSFKRTLNKSKEYQ
jgi:RNase P subunit RPR2